MTFNPQNCSGGAPKNETAKLEAILAECRARKASAKPGTPAPLIGCLSESAEALRRSQALEATKARLEAITAQAKAITAKSTAKAAVAAIIPTAPTARGKQEPMPTCPSNLTGQARKDWHRAMDTFGPATAKYAPDGLLQGLATHGSTSDEDRKTAKAELDRRGWCHNEASSCWSRSVL